MGALLRKIKGKGAGVEDVTVPFDPMLWSKEGCNNRRYMLPGIACSVSRPHRTAPLPAYLPHPPYLRCPPCPPYLPSPCPPACVCAGARPVRAP